MRRDDKQAIIKYFEVKVSCHLVKICVFLSASCLRMDKAQGIRKCFFSQQATANERYFTDEKMIYNHSHSLTGIIMTRSRAFHNLRMNSTKTRLIL